MHAVTATPPLSPRTTKLQISPQSTQSPLSPQSTRSPLSPQSTRSPLSPQSTRSPLSPQSTRSPLSPQSTADALEALPSPVHEAACPLTVQLEAHRDFLKKLNLSLTVEDFPATTDCNLRVSPQKGLYHDAPIIKYGKVSKQQPLKNVVIPLIMETNGTPHINLSLEKFLNTLHQFIPKMDLSLSSPMMKDTDARVTSQLSFIPIDQGLKTEVTFVCNDTAGQNLHIIIAPDGHISMNQDSTYYEIGIGPEISVSKERQSISVLRDTQRKTPKVTKSAKRIAQSNNIFIYIRAPLIASLKSSSQCIRVTKLYFGIHDSKNANFEEDLSFFLRQPDFSR
jgi:hypothetical protein